ncbi:MAG: co-chaperone GroES family protein [Ignavibacteria bacterium]|nr:co-chaperone GroES family protein [Ignavibacteria bacterium]
MLIKPKSLSERTKTGLYLPPGVQEKEVVQSGYVMKVGPGYPLAQTPDEFDEPWKSGGEEKVKYIPLQVREGDLAIFMQKGSIEVLYKDEKYYIVPQHQILMVERDDF